MSISPLQFLRQVKQEMKKVTWPTKKEVVPTCVMVIALVAVATAFFFAVTKILFFDDLWFATLFSFYLFQHCAIV